MERTSGEALDARLRAMEREIRDLREALAVVAARSAPGALEHGATRDVAVLPAAASAEPSSGPAAEPVAATDDRSSADARRINPWMSAAAGLAAAAVQGERTSPPSGGARRERAAGRGDASRGSSFEALVAGRGLAVSGLVLVLMGAALFLELAFTRGWIGPAARIAIGATAGLALLLASSRFLDGRYRYVAEGVAGLGAGILYLSLWAAVAVFPELEVSRGFAFAAMSAVTALVATLAAIHRSQRLAAIALIGGLATPLLLSDGEPDRAAFGAYLLLLTGGMLGVSVRLGFTVVDALAVGGALLFSKVFAPDAPAGWTPATAASLATGFVSLVAGLLILGGRREPATVPVRAVILAAALAAYATQLESIFGDDARTLGFALLGLAAVGAAAARAAAIAPRMRGVFAGAAITAGNLALSAFVPRYTGGDAAIVEGAILVFGGVRSSIRIAYAGVALLALSGIALVFSLVFAASGYPGEWVLASAIWVASALASRRELLAKSIDIPGFAYAGVAINVVALAGASRAVVDAFGGSASGTFANAPQLAISLLWTLYAIGLLGYGLRRGDALVRWEGLALFGVTIVKVFTVDLSALDAAYRVLSFVGLGAVLVAVSVWYTRATRERGDAAP